MPQYNFPMCTNPSCFSESAMSTFPKVIAGIMISLAPTRFPESTRPTFPKVMKGLVGIMISLADMRRAHMTVADALVGRALVLVEPKAGNANVSHASCSSPLPCHTWSRLGKNS